MTYSRFILAALFLYLPCCATNAHLCENPQTEQAAKQQAEKYHLIYQQLVARAKKGDSTVDYVQMIAASMDWDMADKYQTEPLNRDEMVAAFKAKNYKKAVELAEIVLDYEFTNRSLHRATENAYRALGNTLRADFHYEIADKILKALLSTGDGKTVETAYCVQGINEEYVIMAYFGYEVSLQAYIVNSASQYDLLEGKDKKTGEKAGLYFDISGDFSRCVQSHQQRQKNDEQNLENGRLNEPAEQAAEFSPGWRE